MNVISISTDRNILNENSPSRARQIEYGQLFSETHIILFCKKSFFEGGQSGRDGESAQTIQISPNVWVYPTNSFSRINYFNDAFRLASKIIEDRNFLSENTVVTTQDPFETGIVGRRIKKQFNFPLHIQIHTDIFSPYFAKLSMLNFLRVKIAKKILPKADAIRVVSQRIADSLVSYKKNGLKISVEPKILPIFVDIAKIKNSQVSISSDLHKKYPEHDFIILMTTRLAREKNISLAIEVLSEVIRSDMFEQSRDGNQRRSIGLVIVGDGPENLRLRKLVRDLKIEKHVVFEPWQSPENIFSYYKTADLFLSTSWYEGYGLSMIEALVAGCGIVATDAGIAREITDNICPPGDKKCLVGKIASFVGGDRGGNRGENKEIFLKSKQEYLELYKESLGQVFEKN